MLFKYHTTYAMQNFTCINLYCCPWGPRGPGRPSRPSLPSLPRSTSMWERELVLIAFPVGALLDGLCRAPAEREDGDFCNDLMYGVRNQSWFYELMHTVTNSKATTSYSPTAFLQCIAIFLHTFNGQSHSDVKKCTNKYHHLQQFHCFAVLAVFHLVVCSMKSCWYMECTVTVQMVL